jgi:hypothetical protein
MEWFPLFILVAVAILGLRLLARLRRRLTRFPYRLQPALFSPAERSFLGALEQALGDELRIFGKIRVADVVKVEGVRDRSARQRAFNRIQAKHFDFLLCRPDDLSVVAAIELDDRSHGTRKRKERDNFLRGVCEAAGLPLLNIPAQRSYSVAELRRQVGTVASLTPSITEPEGGKASEPAGIVTDRRPG